MKQKELKQPFFASFLENQLTGEESRSVQGGGDPTSKTDDIYQTQKYPSDQEDDVTKPDWDCILTQKYPSDHDEAETA